MNRKEVFDIIKKYSSDTEEQRAFKNGFQEACNMIRVSLEKDYNDEFCEKMEELAEVAQMDLDIWELRALYSQDSSNP